MRRKPPAGLPPAPATPPLSPEDQEALASFCDDVAFVDISFSDWCAAHTSLDLTLEHHLEREHLHAGGHTTLHYTRTHKRADTPVRRERCQQEVVWQPTAATTLTLTVSGAGDCQDAVCGDLIVQLRCRD